MTLGELIERARDKSGESYREMADRAQEAGFSITGGSIHRLATSELRSVPDTQTLHALSVALDETVETVALASVASVGIALSPEVINQSRARAWLALTEGRSDAEVEHLMKIAASVADALDSAAGAAVPRQGADPRGDDDLAEREPGEGPQRKE